MTKTGKQKIYVKVGVPTLVKKYAYSGSAVECVEILYCPTLRLQDETLDSAIEKLLEFKKTYGGKYEKLSFDDVRDCGCYGDCSCSPTTYLYGYREESDIEYNYRVAQEEERKLYREAKEREEYERLAKKFGNK